MNRFWAPKLGDVTEAVRTWNPARDANAAFRYIDLSSVDQDAKLITGAVLVEPAEAPSRARQLIRADDVLVSTVRPNLNAVARVTTEYDGATASTGFCVLRPSPGKVDPTYLFHWVRAPQFVNEMVRNATGASYPAVSDRIVKNSIFPLPPLDEQRRIAAILDKANALSQKRKRAIALLDSLAESIFVEMFGDPRDNSFSWPLHVLSDLATKITDGEHQTPRRTAAGIKLLSARNIQMGSIETSNVDYIDDEEFTRISARIFPEIGDVLISCSGTIGRVATIRTFEKYALVRSVALVRPMPEILNSLYLEHYLRTSHMQTVMKLAANASGQPNLFQNKIKKLTIMVPPAALQKQFSNKVVHLINLAGRYVADARNLGSMFASLQHRAFSGQL